MKNITKTIEIEINKMVYLLITQNVKFADLQECVTEHIAAMYPANKIKFEFNYKNLVKVLSINSNKV